MSLDYSVAAMAVIRALKTGDDEPAPAAKKPTDDKKDMFRKYQGSTDPGIMLSRHHSEQNVDGSFDIKNTDGGYVASVSLSQSGQLTVDLA